MKRPGMTTSGELARRDSRSRGLMHRTVRGIRDPGLLVDHRQAPDAALAACNMIEPRHRAIVDIEGKPLVRKPAKREPKRSLDGAAVTRDDHIPARLFRRDALDRVLGAIVEIHEALAARRRLVDRREPEAPGRLARQERRAVHALPCPEMLLGEGLFLDH